MINTGEYQIQILPDATAVAKQAAQHFIEASRNAIEQKGVFEVALAGGSTPKAMYAQLAQDESLREKNMWSKTQLFFGDERHAGPDDPQSNFRMANEVLLSKAGISAGQVHRIHGEYDDTERAAAEYEELLRKHFRLRNGELPRFDLMLLGMGNEGHTLSLFPGTKALRDNGRLVVSNWVGKLYTERITMTAPVACNAAMVIFMVTGADKAPALKAVLEGPHEPEQLPAQLIKPVNGQLFWLVDESAGSMLSEGPRK
jgi:6-phosphogluconolactonase